jgi:hypothetical protein
MTWSAIFLFCFAVGFVFSALSYLAGGLHWHVHVGPHGAGGGAPHVVPGAHTASGAPAGTGGLDTVHGGAARTSAVSRVNFVTIAAFLAWFGGMGYLLTRYSRSGLLLTLLVAGVSGLGGATAVSLFLTRVLMSGDEDMDPEDYQMVGVLGRVSSAIRESGTGEILFSQGGTRRGCAARSDNGAPIAAGTEVVVTRYEHGMAYVRSWTDLGSDV